MKLSLALLFLAALPAVDAAVQCGVAKDLVVQALENLQAHPGSVEVQNGIQLFKHAIQLCPSTGDAWYYRALFEQQLGDQRAYTFSMQQADLIGSTAKDAQINPFRIAAPATPALLANSRATVREKWALVIGVGKFKNKIDMLSHTSKDAIDFAAFLKDPNYGRFQESNVKCLTDETATTESIKAGLNWIARSAQPDDLVVVFVASHGTARRQDSVAGLNYILTHDTNPYNEDTLFGSAMPMVELSEIIRSRVSARRTAVFLDTCHSGGAGAALVKEKPPSSQSLNAMRAGVGRVIISSSQENQLSFESNDLENGIFTHYLLEALKREQGKIPLSVAFQSLAQQVAQAVKAEYQAVQVPAMAKSDQGAEIILGVESAAPHHARPPLPDIAAIL